VDAPDLIIRQAHRADRIEMLLHMSPRAHHADEPSSRSRSLGKHRRGVGRVVIRQDDRVVVAQRHLAQRTHTRLVGWERPVGTGLDHHRVVPESSQMGAQRPRHVGGGHDDEPRRSPMRLQIHLDVPKVVMEHPRRRHAGGPDVRCRLDSLLVELGTPQRAAHGPTRFDRHRHADPTGRLPRHHLHRLHLDPLTGARIVRHFGVTRRMRSGRTGKELDRVRQDGQDGIERLPNTIGTPGEIDDQRIAERAGHRSGE
jgi:hypothetical protein